MRKHKYKEIPQYGVKYRPLTIGEVGIDGCIIGGEKLFLHQRDYVHLMAIFDSMNITKVGLQIKCPTCKELIKFDLNKNAIMVDEFEDQVFGDDIKISVRPYTTGAEMIPDLIEFVVIDGEQIPWSDCKESEKEAVLNSIDYNVFKTINSALEQPAAVANIPVRCSCGYNQIVSLRGLEAFLKVV